MDAEMQVVIARLDALRERIDDMRHVSAQRHDENTARMKSIEGKQDFTNGKVTRNAYDIETLFRKVGELTKRLTGHSADGKGITKRDVYMFALGGGGVIAAWKFVEWAVHLLKVQP